MTTTYVDTRLDHPPLPPLTECDIIDEVRSWISTQDNLGIIVGFKTTVPHMKFSFAVVDKTDRQILYLFDIFPHHQIHHDADRSLNDNAQIYYRSPEFISYLGEILFEGKNFEVKPEYAVERPFIKGVFISPQLIRCARRTKIINYHRHNGYNCAYGLIGMDRVESPAERVENMIRTRRCDRALTDMKRRSSVIDSINHCIKSVGWAIMAVYNSEKKIFTINN